MSKEDKKAAENAALKKSNAKVKVKFLKSPTSAPFFLGYNEGEVVEINVKQAAELIDAEVAVEVK